jgi:hypothetical protein
MACKKNSVVYTLPLLAIIILGAACSTTYQTHDLVTPTKLNRGENVYLVTAQDGAYSGVVYKGSGMRATTALHAAIAPYCRSVTISKTTESLDHAVASAIAYNCRYIMTPTLTNWEPRAAWSGNPTKVSLNIEVYDLISGQAEAVMHKNLGVTGRSVTVVSQNPDDILNHLLKVFAQEAF